MFTWIDGRLVAAWIVLLVLAAWLPGYINLRIRIRARRRIMRQGGAR